MEHRKLPISLLVGAVLGAVGLAATPAAAQHAPDIQWSFQDQGVVGSIRAIDFSPDGRFVAYGYEFSREIFIRRATDGRLMETLAGSASMGMTAVEFSPVSDELASTWSILGWSGIPLGGAERYRPGSTLPGMTSNAHDAFVTDLAWAPNGSLLLTGATDGSAVLADPVTGATVLEVDHGDDVASVAFSPDGLRFATGGFDGIINIWDTGSGLLLRSIQAHLSFVSRLAFHPDNIHLASGGGDALVDSAVLVHDSTTGAFINAHVIQQEGVSGLEWILGGSFLMHSDLSGIIRISQPFTPNEVATIDLGRGPRVTGLDWDDASGRYAYGTESGWVTMARR
ncbi:MAG: WD40 repeat domain-containing protein [Planctomycetota bacterium]|jgi:WD40 repeat protein